MIGARPGSVERGAEYSESGTESDTLELPALQRNWLVFGSIAAEITAPGPASNRLSLGSTVGSELMVGVNT